MLSFGLGTTGATTASGAPLSFGKSVPKSSGSLLGSVARLPFDLGKSVTAPASSTKLGFGKSVPKSGATTVSGAPISFGKSVPKGGMGWNLPFDMGRVISPAEAYAPAPAQGWSPGVAVQPGPTVDTVNIDGGTAGGFQDIISDAASGILTKMMGGGGSTETTTVTPASFGPSAQSGGMFGGFSGTEIAIAAGVVGVLVFALSGPRTGGTRRRRRK